MYNQNSKGQLPMKSFTKLPRKPLYANEQSANLNHGNCV